MWKSIIGFLAVLIACPVVVLSQDKDDINPNGYNVFYYDDGTKSSEGEFKNGKPNGYWKTYYPNGKLKSEGNRVNHELDSVWIFYREDGALIEKIEYEKGERNGFTFKYNEEGLLESKIRYENDVKNGPGYIYDPELQQVKTEKYFVDGKAEGTAYEYAEDGRVHSVLTYEKGFLKDRMDINRRDPKGKKTGLWIEYYDDVEPPRGVEKVKKLEGRYRMGLKNGYFREYDRNGELLNTLKYVDGEVVENVEELMAVEKKRTFHPNAQVEWEKTYLNDQPHGIWKKYNDTGKVVKSQIYNKGVLLGEGIIDKRGLKQGEWVEYYPTGEVRAKGEYLDGARYKDWKFFFKDEQVEQTGRYVKGGKPHGVWKWYYDDGSLLREEEFRNGKEDGEIVEYDRNGEILLKGYYVDGMRDGEWYIVSGDYLMEGKYMDDRRYGEWKHYFIENDELAFEGDFLDGLPDGRHKYYHPNGKRRLIGHYEGGQKHGDWSRFDKEGQLILTIEYEADRDKRIEGKEVKIEP